MWTIYLEYMKNEEKATESFDLLLQPIQQKKETVAEWNGLA